MLFDAFSLGERGTLLYGLYATAHGMRFGPSRTREDCYYNEKYHTFQRKCYLLTKQESIYFVPCPTEGSNLTEGVSLFCPKQKQGCDFYPTVASLSPSASLVPLGWL